MKIKHLDGLYNRSVFRIMTMILFFLFLGVGNTFSNVNASNAPDEQLQQGKKIKGVVRDETGEPIIGANVIEKGTSNGLITDLDGAFSLEVKPGSTLVISYIGYISQEIPITDNTTTLNIKLVEDSKTLDEVVVVG